KRVAKMGSRKIADTLDPEDNESKATTTNTWARKITDTPDPVDNESEAPFPNLLDHAPSRPHQSPENGGPSMTTARFSLKKSKYDQWSEL
ncbi:3779_t:CDS:2, partial [Acaulospora colombiana]